MAINWIIPPNAGEKYLVMNVNPKNYIIIVKECILGIINFIALDGGKMDYNSFNKIKSDITNLRDGLGAASLIISSRKLIELVSNQTGQISKEDISKQLGVSPYSLEPLIDLLTHFKIIPSSVDSGDSLTESQRQYITKMLDALPLYCQLANYVSKASGSLDCEISGFNQFITNASSRLSGPAVDKIIQIYPQLETERIKLVDVGCGIGEYLVTFAQRNPQLQAVGIERDGVVAKKADINIKEHNLDERVKILNADFLKNTNTEPLNDADIVMMNHIYHVVGEDLSYKMTKRTYDLLKKGGLFLNLEICKDYPGQDVLIPILFDALMRFHYPENEGKIFKKENIESIMQRSGFKMNDPLVIGFDTPNMVYFIGSK